MELKFREVDNRYLGYKNLFNLFGEEVDGVKKDLKIKPYLEVNEINSILNQCLGTSDQLEREIIKICKVVEYCTNIDLGNDEKINGEEVCNLVYSNRLYNYITENVDNYYNIDNLLEKQENIYNVFSDLSVDINDKLDELLKQFNPTNTKEMIEELKTVVDKKEKMMK